MSSTYRSQTPQSQRTAGSSSAAVDGTVASSSTAGGGKASASPFVSNSHGHPSFNPVKIGAKGAVDSKIPKQPKAPDKPLMPYMRYSRKVSRLVWDSVKASNPDLKLWEIGKIIGQMWRELSDDEKQEYLDEYDAEKLQYTEALKAYHNSPAYQSWLSAKGKSDLEAESEEPEKTRRTKAPGAGSSAAMAESKSISMQPCEEDDDNDDSYSIKHVAAARFHRNHCLINEIFSDAVVPDVRTVINEGRMAVLKRQVLSLTMHQKKLEGELEIIEQKHTGKKGQFSQSSERFYEDLAKLCSDKPQVTEDQFTAMVVKAKEELREKQRLALLNQQHQLIQLQQQPGSTVEKTAAADTINEDSGAEKKELENGEMKMNESGLSGDVQPMETELNDKSSEQISQTDSVDGSALPVQESANNSAAVEESGNMSTGKDGASASNDDSLPTSNPSKESEDKSEQPASGKTSETADTTTKAKNLEKSTVEGKGSEVKVSSGSKRKNETEDTAPSKHGKISSSTEAVDKVKSTDTKDSQSGKK